MARKVQALLLCDVHDGAAEAQATISFTVDGTAFEIDLCASHENDLRGIFGTYISCGRKAAGARPPDHDVRQRERAAEIRRWARKRGIMVSGQGRLPVKVMELYATTGKPPPA